MARSLRSPGHCALMQALVLARTQSGMTQQVLADKLRRPQSYVAKVETGERRLDVVEFVEWGLALDAELEALIAPVAETMRGTGTGTRKR